MNNQQNNPVSEPPAEQNERRENVPSSPRTKKPFVEPVVSVPVDVLEATSYFMQVALDSGAIS